MTSRMDASMRADRDLRDCAHCTRNLSGGRVIRAERVGEQSVAFRFDDLIALTSPGLQAGTVDNGDVAATVAD